LSSWFQLAKLFLRPSQSSAINNLPSVAAATADRNRTNRDDEKGDWRVSALARFEQAGESKAA
jgi:hypothetical protein